MIIIKKFKNNEKDIIFYKEEHETAVLKYCMLYDDFVGVAACVMR
jgi:hypothetical protein